MNEVVYSSFWAAGLLTDGRKYRHEQATDVSFFANLFLGNHPTQYGCAICCLHAECRYECGANAHETVYLHGEAEAIAHLMEHLALGQLFEARAFDLIWMDLLKRNNP